MAIVDLYSPFLIHNFKIILVAIKFGEQLILVNWRRGIDMRKMATEFYTPQNAHYEMLYLRKAN